MAVNSTILGILAGQSVSFNHRGDSATLKRHPTNINVVYSSLANRYRDEPLYMLNNTLRTRNYALGLKQNAIKLENSMGDFTGDNFEKSLAKAEAHSTNPDIALVRITPQAAAAYASHLKSADDATLDDASSMPNSVELDVLQLAGSQKNVGKYMADGLMSLPPNTYSFDVSVNDMKFEFQFVVSANSTNHDFLQKLSRLINSSRVGLSSQVLYEDSYAAIEIKSAAVGAPVGKDLHFEINDDNSSKAKGLVAYLGLNNIESMPKDAQFLVDGEARSHNSNKFVLDETYAVTLLKSDPNGYASTILNISDSNDALSFNVDKLFGGYNTFIKAANAYAATQNAAARLITDLSSISSGYRPHLGVYGIKFETNGTVEVNKDELLNKAAMFGNKKLIPYLEQFANTVYDKSSEIAFDPMKYSDRTMVAYKSFSPKFSSPYVTNAYSGMCFDSTC